QELLSGAAARLAQDTADIGLSLRDAVASIDLISAESGDGAIDERCASVLDELLRGSYTMASERNIHDTFVANPEVRFEAGDKALAEPAALEQTLDDCLF